MTEIQTWQCSKCGRDSGRPVSLAMPQQCAGRTCDSFVFFAPRPPVETIDASDSIPDFNSIAAAIHRSRMAQAIGKRSAKEKAAGERALHLAAADIAVSCGFDRPAFLRACGLH